MVARLTLAAVLVLSIPFAAFGEALTVFDDFETGPMPPVTNAAGPPQQFTQTPLPLPNCLAGERTVLVHAQAFSAIPPGTIDDRLITEAASPLPGPTLLTSARYEFAPALDLTGGGQHDQLRFEIGPVAGILQLRVLLYAPGAVMANAVANIPVNAPGAYSLPFSQFAAPVVLLQNVAKVEIETRSGGAGGPYELHLRRVMLASQNVVQPGLELPEETLTIVQHAIAARQITGSWTNPLDNSQLTNHIDLSIDNVEDGGGGIFPGKLEYGDTGGGGGTAGLLAGLTMQTSDGSFSDGSLSMSLDFVANGTIEMLQGAPILSVNTGDFAILNFQTEVYVAPGKGSGGAAKGTAQEGSNFYQITLGGGPGGENSFANLLPSGSPGGTSVGLAFDIQNLGAQTGLECDPAFTISMVSHFVPSDPSTATPSPISPLSLSARPSVFGAATRFELSQALSRSAVVQIFDLRGRLVGRLPLGAGVRSSSWDGRGEDGSALASGVYFARLSEDPRATTRVTLVR